MPAARAWLLFCAPHTEAGLSCTLVQDDSAVCVQGVQERESAQAELLEAHEQILETQVM